MKTETRIQNPEAERLGEIFAFCRGRKCFANWSGEVLRDYLAFHQEQNTLFVQTCGTAIEPRGYVIGVGIAWRVRWADLTVGVLNQPHVFRWKQSDGTGDNLFVAEVEVAEGNGKDMARLRKYFLTGLCRQMAARFPMWDILPVWTLRRGVLHRFNVKTLERLLKGGF